MILRTGNRWLFLIVICLFHSCLKKLNCFKINAPSVLLAYNLGLPSNFSVEITGAKPEECFQWQSTNPHIVSVAPIYHASNCSKRAILSSVANSLERKVTEVSARMHGENDNQINIDVITDTVAEVELSYLTDEVALGSAPEILTVIGKDKHGHTFTSINGLEVRWKITHHLDQSEKSTDDDLSEANTEVIRILKFDASEYESPEEGSQLEKRGLFSNTVLAEAVKLGTAHISASLLFSSKSVLSTQEISLKVVPNWRIHPSTSINLLLHASVNVRIEKFLNGKFKEVNMENFKADVEEDIVDVIKMSEDFSHFYASKYGPTTISYKNINKSYPDLAVAIQVVELSRISLRISNGDFKTLEEMKIYEVILDLYDESDNLIYASDNIRFSVSFPTKLFHVIFTSANGTYAIVQTIAPGSGAIRVAYKGVTLEDGSISKEHAVSGSFDITVCQRLNIFPPQTLLPLLSDGETFYEVSLVVTGGTGDYAWALNNYTVAKVVENKEKKNFLRLEVYGEVDLILTVTDKNNINFIATSKVSVQRPLDIETYPTVVEAEVGNVLIIPTALLGYEDKEKNIIRKFDDCSKMEPSVEIIEKYVLSYEKESKVPEFGKGCMSLQFRCMFSGHSRVNIEYTVKTTESTNITYKTTTVLACFKPLKPVQPVRVAVLALGTSKEVAFEGGPRKWPLFKQGHYSELEASDPNLVKIDFIKDPVRYNKDLSVFRVTCKALGENTLTFRIGNRPSATIQHPAKAEASIKFICAEPHSVHLKLEKKKTSNTPKDERVVKVPFYGEKIFAVDIWVKDATGRKFANISSLRVVWDVSDKTLAEPESYFDFMTHENAVAGYRKLSRDFKEFKLTGDEGDLIIEAKVTTYRKEVLSKEEIQDYKELQEISKSIDLQLVSLRNINNPLYNSLEDKKAQEGYCENDSCNS